MALTDSQREVVNTERKKAKQTRQASAVGTGTAAHPLDLEAIVQATTQSCIAAMKSMRGDEDEDESEKPAGTNSAKGFKKKF
jgi:hypothetical protein